MLKIVVMLTFTPTLKNRPAKSGADGVGRDSAPKGQEEKELLKALARVGFIFILLSNSIFAYAAWQDNPEKDKEDNPAALRELIMDEILDKIMAVRDLIMDEIMYKLIAQRESASQESSYRISQLKGKGKFFFDPVARNAALHPALKNKDSAANFVSLQNYRNALGFRVESEDENRRIASSSLSTHRSRSLFEESLETDFKGSVYHPNLASFDINLENGSKQSKEKFQPNLTGKLKNSYLDRFHILSSFLRKKPYGFSLLADKSREIENREFFERQTIDSVRYAGNFGFKNKFIPVGLSFSNSSKNIGRAASPSQDFQDNEVSLNLSNESKIIGETRLEAAQDKFSRTESGAPDQKGTSRNFDLINQQSLSSDNKKLLYSSLQFYDLTGTRASRLLNLGENLNIEHSDYLSSSYNYNFSDRSSSGVKTTDNRVSASLRHKLYESLTSTFSPYYFKSDASAFSQDSYGLSLEENYMKKLGKAGKLTLGTGLTYSQEKRKTFDNIISIIDESHTLTTGTVIFLDKPQVDTSTVVVTNLAGTTTYILNIDYQLSSAGENTQIQRITGGSISNGQQVLVDYQAKGSPAVKFNTLGNNFSARIDFLDELIGVFYRLNKERHPKVSGTDDFILQTLSDTSLGVDFNYKNLKVEFEDEDYNSNLSPYKRLQLRESIFFNFTEKSTLTFQSSQIIVRLVNTQDTQRFFDYINRYTIGLNRYSRFNLEAGFRWQEGTGINLNNLIASANYELNFGKFLMNAEYDFKKQLYLSDRLINHFFFTKIKRTF